MRRTLIPFLLASLALASAAFGAVGSAAAAGAVDPFTINDIAVGATAQSPREARNLAMAQGRPLAWSKLFRRFTAQGEWASQPQLTDSQLEGLISSVEAGNERRNTTRYLADIVFHFNPAAVRQLLHESNIAFTETRSEPALAISLTAGTPRSTFAADAEAILEKAANEGRQSIDRQKAAIEPAPQSIAEESESARLMANVRFATIADWAKFRARLSAVKTVTEMDVEGLALNEAQIGLTYLGRMDQLRDALAQQNLELSNNAGEYTLEFGTATAANSLPAQSSGNTRRTNR